MYRSGVSWLDSKILVPHGECLDPSSDTHSLKPTLACLPPFPQIQHPLLPPSDPAPHSRNPRGDVSRISASSDASLPSEDERQPRRGDESREEERRSRASFAPPFSQVHAWSRSWLAARILRIGFRVTALIASHRYEPEVGRSLQGYLAHKEEHTP